MLSVPLHQHYHKWKNEQKDIDLAQTCGIIIEMLWTEISRKEKFQKTNDKRHYKDVIIKQSANTENQTQMSKFCVMYLHY